jgi:hypothetical protein
MLGECTFFFFFLARGFGEIFAFFLRIFKKSAKYWGGDKKITRFVKILLLFA